MAVPHLLDARIQGTGKEKPWDTISIMLKLLAVAMEKRHKFGPDEKINVWFTGHSVSRRSEIKMDWSVA